MTWPKSMRHHEFVDPTFFFLPLISDSIKLYCYQVSTRPVFHPTSDSSPMQRSPLRPPNPLASSSQTNNRPFRPSFPWMAAWTTPVALSLISTFWLVLRRFPLETGSKMIDGWICQFRQVPNKIDRVKCITSLLPRMFFHF